MPLEEAVATFSYLVKECDNLGLAYICLCRYVPVFDPTGRGTDHDVLTTYGPLIKKATIVANTGYTPEQAIKDVSEGRAAAISFGIPYIAHPDLAERIKHGKPLDNVPDFLTFYGHGGTEEEERKGYVDYPFAK
jgi:2,4-dienoyl-CoA reductase-like NADH-dependent reductase (Old Yellow Enzyme family)